VRRLRQKLIEMIQAERHDTALIGETIFSLAADIMRRAAVLGSAYETPSERRISDYRVRRAIRMMRDIDGRVGLDQIARGTGLSRSRFNQLFRMCTGVSAGIYHASLRLECAVNGLGVERLPVNLVSEALGFSAQSNFTRFFQQHVGVVPSEFRRVAENADNC
jgi:AraC family transcriptional regulator